MKFSIQPKAYSIAAASLVTLLLVSAPVQADEGPQFDFSGEQRGGAMDEGIQEGGLQTGSGMGPDTRGKEEEDQQSQKQEENRPREKAQRDSEEEKQSSGSALGGSKATEEQEKSEEEPVEEKHDEEYEEYEDKKAQNGLGDKERKAKLTGRPGVRTKSPEPASVPEPGTLLGLGILASSLGLLKRR